MYLFYDKEIGSHNHVLSAEESKHCIRVLRLRKGDTVHLTDGRGNLYETRIVTENDKRCELMIIGHLSDQGKRNYRVHIGIAPTKNISRLEWFLEKATEMGIDKITPVICENSERTSINAGRLNKVITASMKQSLKTYLPELENQVKFADFIRMQEASDKFIAHCTTNKNQSLKKLAVPGRNTIVLIGPEGDFTSDEIKQAIQRDFIPVNLGPSRLRTETAALYTCFTLNLVNL